jgi:alkylation response protein AidB-like acyl-CoA dehydrogenase
VRHAVHAAHAEGAPPALTAVATLERYHRGARTCRIFDGTSQIHCGIIARGLRRRGAALFDIER